VIEKNYPLPDSWEWAYIGSIGQTFSGGTPRTSELSNFDGDIPWITPADLTGYNERYISKGRRNISDQGLRNSSARLMPEGAVLFSSRAPIGYVVIASNPLCTNQGFKNVVPAEGIDSRFVYYYLKSAKELAESMASGTTFRELSGSRFEKLPIPVAPLSEQKRIVDKIETLFSDLDKGEALLKQVQQQLAVYRQSVLKDAVTGELTRDWRENNKHRLESGEALLKRVLTLRRVNWKGRGKYKEPVFIDTSLLPEIPDLWRWVSIDTLVRDERTAIKAGPFGSALKKDFYVSSGYKIYGQEQVISGDAQYGDYYISEEKFEQLKSCEVKPFDVLISLVGTIGKVMVLPENIEPGIINPRLIKISFDLNIYDPKFFKMYFESAFVKSMYQLDAHGATMDILNLSIIKNLPFILCSIDEQEEIVSRVDDIFSQIDALEKWCSTELARSGMLRQSILMAAFSGELVPQDPEDEPASELLARIQAERASAALDGNGRRAATKRGRKAIG
jgi:type I restriction enzyme, S subunit